MILIILRLTIQLGLCHLSYQQLAGKSNSITVSTTHPQSHCPQHYCVDVLWTQWLCGCVVDTVTLWMSLCPQHVHTVAVSTTRPHSRCVHNTSTQSLCPQHVHTVAVSTTRPHSRCVHNTSTQSLCPQHVHTVTVSTTQSLCPQHIYTVIVSNYHPYLITVVIYTWSRLFTCYLHLSLWLTWWANLICALGEVYWSSKVTFNTLS